MTDFYFIYTYVNTTGWRGYETLTISLTYHGVVGKCEKTISPRRKEGRVEKKNVRSVPTGVGAQTWDLSRARRESPAVRHGNCLDK